MQLISDKPTHIFPSEELLQHKLEQEPCPCGTRTYTIPKTGEVLIIHTSFATGETPTDEELQEIPNNDDEYDFE